MKQDRPAPAGYQPVETDPVTGKTVGWEPVEQSSFAKVFADALGRAADLLSAGTYELAGPKVNGNPERLGQHTLLSHADAEVSLDDGSDGPRTYDAIRDLVLGLAEVHGWEGIVYHHPDGRMAKIKARDFSTVAHGAVASGG